MNYYVGLSLAASSGLDSGVAVLDEDNNLILVDKLYTMNDVMFFFDNFCDFGFENLLVDFADVGLCERVADFQPLRQLVFCNLSADCLINLFKREGILRVAERHE